MTTKITSSTTNSTGMTIRRRRSVWTSMVGDPRGPSRAGRAAPGTGRADVRSAGSLHIHVVPDLRPEEQRVRLVPRHAIRRADNHVVLYERHGQRQIGVHQ